MIVFRQSVILFGVLTFSMLVNAAPTAPPTPEDFAYGIKIETEGQASVWHLRVPDDVYRKVTRPDLGDIRIFDATGRVIPHTLRRPEATIKEPPVPVSLPIFPLYQTGKNDSVGQTVRIITDDKGTITKDIRETVSIQEDEFISAYLLDATKIQSQPDRLILGWESVTETGFSGRVNVDVSDDLSEWRRLVSNATLADLQFDGHQLFNSEISVPVRPYNYLRISWPIALREVRLKKVTASFPYGKHPPQQQWIKISGIKIPEEASSYDFDTQGNWPVNQARIVFPTGNVLIKGELASRPEKKSIWNRRYLGQFYKLVQEKGTLLISSPVTFKTTSDRYWRLEEVGGGNLLDRNSPVLELAWVPHILTFVAQGDPPYMLAYGSASVGPQEQSLPQMVVSVHGAINVTNKAARTTQGFLLGGTEKLVPPPEPLPWKAWLLWLVLITGVALLAWMVWRLSREMGNSLKQQD